MVKIEGVRKLDSKESIAIVKCIKTEILARAEAKAIKTSSETVDLLYKIPIESFIGSADFEAQLIKNNCVKLVEIMLDANDNQPIANNSIDSGYFKEERCGAAYLIATDPSKKMIKLYLEKGVYTVEELLNEAAKIEDKDTMKKIAEVANLSAEDFIKYLNF